GAPRKRSAAPLVAALVLGALGVGSVATWLLVKRNQKPSPAMVTVQPVPSATATVEAATAPAGNAAAPAATPSVVPSVTVAAGRAPPRRDGKPPSRDGSALRKAPRGRGPHGRDASPRPERTTGNAAGGRGRQASGALRVRSDPRNDRFEGSSPRPDPPGDPFF